MTKNKYFLGFVLLTSTLFSCKKDDTTIDNSFFIQATINGKSWRGESGGDYYAVNSTDTSKMKIFIDSNFTSITSLNFLSNTTLLPYSLTNTNFNLQNFVIGTFDSKVLLKWETTTETNLSKFEIQQATIDGSNYFAIGQVDAFGTSTSTRQYSWTPNISMWYKNSDYLNTLKFRLKIIHKSGSVAYTSDIPVNYTVSKVQIGYAKTNGAVYFGLDNNQNQMTITSYDQTTKERRGTFSFNYKDELGNIVQVTNGSFHLKQ